MLAALLVVLPLLAPQETTVFRNATVLPMEQAERGDLADDERTLEAHTVVVTDGRIARIAPTGTPPSPEGARVVDATGLFSMPGLVDSHVHVQYEDELARFVLHGVTTVRDMSGRPWHATLRAAVESGERLGPTIHSAARTIDGPPTVWRGSTAVETPDEARPARRAETCSSG